MKIAIDGPSGAGKTTVGKALAQHFGYKFINTGLMYRAVAWGLKQGLKLTEMQIDYEDDKVFLNGRLLRQELYSPEMDEDASKTSAIPEVRRLLIKKQRELAQAGNVVMEGRDIATVILPDAEVKIFLNASLKERTRRRLIERPDHKASFSQVLEKLKQRDERDRYGFGRLQVAKDAVIIETNNKSTTEVLEEAIKIVEETLKRVRNSGKLCS